MFRRNTPNNIAFNTLVRTYANKVSKTENNNLITNNAEFLKAVKNHFRKVLRVIPPPPPPPKANLVKNIVMSNGTVVKIARASRWRLWKYTNKANLVKYGTILNAHTNNPTVLDPDAAIFNAIQRKQFNNLSNRNIIRAANRVKATNKTTQTAYLRTVNTRLKATNTHENIKSRLRTIVNNLK